MIRLLLLAFLVLGGMGQTGVGAAENLPPVPTQYVTDEAGVIAPGVLADLNRQLAAFEKATSNQIFAVVYPKLPAGVEINNYAQQLATAWRIGQKKKSNGVLILIFVQNKKAVIQTGYGLEGALPDVLCHRIIREVMSPAFRSGNYDLCLSNGIQAVMQATKGEYKGNGQRVQKPTTLLDLVFSPLGFFVLVMLVLVISNRGRRDGGGGISPGTAAATGFFLGGGGGGWGSGGSGGGGDSGGAWGGGGDFGGGGSSGDL